MKMLLEFALKKVTDPTGNRTRDLAPVVERSSALRQELLAVMLLSCKFDYLGFPTNANCVFLNANHECSFNLV